MKTIKYFIGLWLMMTAINSCKNTIPKPLSKSNGAPGPISNVRVENLPGAAKITYTLPDNKDLLYVRAVYTTGDVKREVRASFYNYSLIVTGFGHSGNYEMKLYAVNNSEQASTPVTVEVHPTDPPVNTIFKSLSTSATFGGISVKYSNTTQAPVSIHVITPDSAGDWVSADIFYTESKDGIVNVRGYPPVEKNFGVYVKDQYGNISDTLMSTVVPIEEVELDKSKFLVAHFPGDWGHCCGVWYEENLWNGSVNGGEGYAAEGLPDSDPNSMRFSFDLGVKAKLSRYRLWGRPSANYWYNVSTPRSWEIWGSNDPAPDGSYNGWTKLMSCTMVKPSGLPIGQNSTEDIDAANAGFEFTFPADAPAVKYIRFKMVGLDWAGTFSLALYELTLWGKVVQ